MISNIQAQEPIIRISYESQPPVGGVVRVHCRKASHLFAKRLFSLHGGVSHFVDETSIGGIASSCFASCVLWDQCLFYILVKSVEVDVGEERTEH